MMKRRFFAGLLALFMLCSFCALPAAAADDVSGAGRGDFYSWGAHSIVGGGGRDGWGGGCFGGGGGRSAYDTYVSGLQTDLGTSVLGDGCLLIPVNFVHGESAFTDAHSTYSGNHLSCSWAYEDGENSTLSFGINHLVAPISGDYQLLAIIDSVSNVHYLQSSGISPTFFDRVSIDSNYILSSAVSRTHGASIDSTNPVFFVITRYISSTIVSISLSLWLKCIPSNDISSLTTHDVSISSRSTILIGSYLSEDNTAYNTQIIVDETNLTYTNPVTAQTYPVTSWAYDYATRTYTLILQDGTTATVCYGDDCLTLSDHGNSYTLYYKVDSGTTDPGGSSSSSSGSSSSGSGDSGGGLSILGLLGKIFDFLGGLISSLVTALIDALKALFVPSEDFFSGSIGDLRSLFEGKMGLITYPTSVVFSFFDRVINLQAATPVFTWTNISWMGTTIIQGGSYNLEDSLTTDGLRNLHQIYLDCVSVILIFGFLDLCYKKYRAVIDR